MRFLNGKGWMPCIWPEHFRSPREQDSGGSQPTKVILRLSAITFAFLLSAFHFAASAQNRAEYFFDSDPGPGSGTSLALASGDSVTITPSISVASLSVGFHTLYVRSRMGGRWSQAESRGFFKMATAVSASRKIKKIEYFFDTDPGINEGNQFTAFTAADSVEVTRTISITGLTSGFHVLYIRTQDETNSWSQSESRPFYISPTAGTTAGPITRLEYFFDTDPGAGLGTSITISPSADSSEKVSSIPIASLSTGFHTIYVRAKNNRGWSLAESRTFFITSSASLSAGPISKLEYFFDTDPGVGLGTGITISPSADSSEKTSVIPISSLSAGFHTLYIRAKNNNGWSQTEARSFYVYPNTSLASGPVAKMEYFIDTDPGVGQGTPLTSFTSGDSVEVTRVVAIPNNISEGAHKLYVRSQTTDKRWSITEVKDFTVSCGGVVVTATQTQICSGQPTTLSFASGNQPGSYQWFRNGNPISGATGFSHTTTLTGSYTLQYINGSCNGTSDPFVIGSGTSATATATASGVTTFCAGGSVNLNANSGTGLTYQWLRNNNIITGQTGVQLANVGASGSYSVIVTNASGCKDTSTVIVVTANPFPNKPFITPSGPITFCDPGSVTLTTSAASGHKWSTGETNPSITVSSSAIIRDTAIVNGCKTVSDPMTITENNCFSLPGSGNAISFDGVDDEIDLGTSFTDQNFTVEMWIRPEATQSTYANIIDNNHSGSFTNWTCQQDFTNTNRYGFGTMNTGVQFTLLANQWQHLALVKGPASIEAYINGILIQSTPYTNGPISFNSNFLRIGNWGGGGRNWNGQMDEVRFWNTALTETQIRDRMCRKIPTNDALFSNLKAYFNFDESSGVTVFNGGTFDIDGTLTNGPARITSGAAIGNSSAHSYVSTGLPNPSANFGSGESFVANFTGGTFSGTAGAHVYVVTEKPNSESGITGVGTNNRYVGVFHSGLSNPQYTGVYNYSGNPFVTVANENDLSLFRRNNNTVSTWTNAGAVRNTTAKTLTVTGQSTEYMMGVGPSALINPGTIGSNQTIECSHTLPALLTSVLDASTTSGNPITYQWQDSTKNGNWVNITDATSATYQPVILTDTTWFRRKATAGSFTDFSNQVVVNMQNAVAGDPAVFPTNTWNVNGYSGTDLALGSGNLYKGFYTTTGLSVNTANQWNGNASPSSASGWQGCPVPVDNFTFVIKRRGFPAGAYVMNNLGHDDGVQVFLDGNKVFEHIGCCDTHSGITLGTLGANSTLEIRVAEGSGGAGASFDLVLSNLVAGSISGDQTLCNGGTPSAFSNTLSASGGPTTTITYQWQDSLVGGTWTNISGANSATFQAPALSATRWYKRQAINGVQTAFSNIVQVTVSNVAGDPAIFPTNNWNMYAYSGNDMNLGSGTTYLGFYPVSGLNVNSANQWGINASPSSAAAYQGCPVPLDGFMFVLKRRGFPAGQYTMNITTHDDHVRVLVNGTQVLQHLSCCDSHNGIDLGTLGSNSTIEVITLEGGGSAQIAFELIVSDFQGGTIAADQNICAGIAPALLTNEADASGGSVTNFTYQWQDSLDGGSWQNIAAATAATFQPPVLTQTKWYRRKATAGSLVVFSNIVQINVFAAPSVSVSPTGPVNICAGESTVLTGTFSTGAGRQWLRNGVVISGQVLATLSVNQSGTYKAVATVGVCTDTSNAVVINVNPKPAPVLSPTGGVTLCEGTNQVITLTNPQSGTTVQWKKNGTPIAGGNFIDITTAGSYYAVVTITATGCKDSSAATVVNVIEPQINPTGTASICQGNSLTLTASNVGNANLKWFRDNQEIVGEANPTLNVTLAGVYRLEASVGATCTIGSNSVTAVVVIPPTATITPPPTTEFCQGSSITLEANTGTGLSYQWKRNNQDINGATSPTLLATLGGDYSVVVTNAGNCSTTSSVVSLIEVPNVTWFLDVDGDHYGAGVTVQNCTRPLNGFLASELTATTGDCNDNDASVNPDRQFFTFSAAQGFESALTAPLTGTPYTSFRFEVKYTDLNNNPPPVTFPRVVLDYEGNGQFNNANDRTILMQQSDSRDNNTNDGKVYFANVNSLPAGQNYTTRILTSIGNCATTIGPFNYPDVFILSDLQIFANDITFDNTNPDVSSPLTINAVIHNVSDFAAQNFVVRLVNQFDPGILYPEIVVANLAPHSDQTVTWNITTPAVPAWCPMQVMVDFTDVIQETNELDNSAIRPFVNGPFNVPGNIVVSPTVSPSTVVGVSGASVTLVGTANYSGTAVPLADPSVAGAQVTFTITPGGQTYTTYTNSSGQINFSFYVPLTPGIYTITGTITDFTLTTSFTTTFVVVPPVCLADLVTSVTVSSNNIVEGESITGNIRVQNVGCEATLDSTLLTISQSGGLPVMENVKVPPLAVNAFFDIAIPATTFSTTGIFTLCGTADGAFQINEQSEGNNSDCEVISVIPFLPDIYPISCGVGGTIYQSPQIYSHSFGFYNSGGSATGPFTVRIIRSLNGVPLDTFDRQVTNLGRQSSGSVSIDVTYDQLGSYSYFFACDIPVPPGVVVETNETNNTSNCGILVLAPQTDLYVTGCENFDVDPVDPPFPGNITLKARVSNGGNLTATAPITVRFTRTSGASEDVIINTNLAPGQSVVVSKTLPTTAPGTDTATVEVDPENLFNEFNEGNNKTSNTLCHESAPVDNFCGGNWWASHYLINQAIFLNVPVVVRGMYNISQLKVRFFVSGPGLNGTLNLGDATLNNLSETCICPYIATLPVNFAFPAEGVYTFTFVTDPDNIYTECNESNNTLVRQVRVTGLPDMRVLSQLINPSKLNPDVGEPITIQGNYENIGMANIDQTMKFKLLVDEVPVDSATVNGLVTGDNFTVNFSTPWSSTLVGSHIIRTIIDADNVVEEGNEANNEATRAVIVGAAANLYFQVFQPSNSNPAVGQNIAINARIGNNGDEAIEAAVIFYYINDQGDSVQIGVRSISLEGHDSTSLSVPWTVLDNNTILIGKIVNGSIMEFNNEDNIATAPVGGFAVTMTSTPACAGKPNGTLTASPTGGAEPFTYQWSNGFNGGSVLTAGPGLYNVLVTDANGVSVLVSGSIPNLPGVRYYEDSDDDGYGNPTRDSVDCVQPPGYVINNLDCDDSNSGIFKKTDKPIISHSGNLVFCSGDSVTLSVPDLDGISYLWSNNQSGTSIVVSTAGLFSVTASQDSGCAATSDPIETSVITNLVPTAFISVSPDSVVCTGTQITFSASTTGGGTSPVSEWLVNGIVEATGGATFSGSNFDNNDRVELRYISSESCANPDTVVSNFIRLTIGNSLIANAGPDQTICDTVTTLVATGNGNWTLLSGTGIVNNSNSATSSVSGLSAGINEFIWTVSSGNCPPASDTVRITVTNPPSPANAGVDNLVCGDSINLNAVIPENGIGSWRVLSGPATVVDTLQNDSKVGFSTFGKAILTWTVRVSGCSAISVDTVEMKKPVPPVANAGSDQSVCGTTATLTAILDGEGRIGEWSKVYCGTFTGNPFAQSVTVTDLCEGENIFILKVTDECDPEGGGPTDEVVITVLPDAVADAGSDQTICETEINLSATPSPSGTGNWSVLQGTALVSNPSDPLALVSNLSPGQNILIWTVFNTPCDTLSDTVVIDRVVENLVSNAGPDQVTVEDTAVVSANVPAEGTGTWALISGTGDIDNASSETTTIRNLGIGVNEFVWTVSGFCSNVSDTIRIERVNGGSVTQSDAGPDQVVCSNSVTLAGNIPLVGKGKWTVISGTGVLANDSLFNSGVSNLSPGENQFIWTISLGALEPSSDTVTITRLLPPDLANAGTDQSICGDSAIVTGNVPQVGVGVWELVSGSGEVSDSSSASTVIKNLGQGDNKFSWTISTQNCGSTSDTVSIFVNPFPTPANAGADQSVCGDTALIQANVPQLGSGSWTLIDGIGDIDGSNSAGTVVRNLGLGANTLVWSITSANCPASTDTLIITRVSPPDAAFAGNDQQLCNTTANLNGNLPANGTGAWTLISGSGTISNPAQHNSAVTNLGFGVNALVWTISSGDCPATTDTVQLAVNPPPVAFAGNDTTLCAESLNVQAADPLPGSGFWSVASGTAGFVNNEEASTTVFGLGLGVTKLVWTTSLGENCLLNTDTLVITRVEVPVANAGPDQILCSQTTTTLAANSLAIESGVWTVISGTAIVSEPSNPNSVVTGLSFGNHVLRWTVSNEPCPDAVDEVTIIVTDQLVANAGKDSTICSNSIGLSGNGQGSWTLISGSGSIQTPNAASTQILGLGLGVNIFQWKLEANGCPSDSDQVAITVSEPATLAIAGPDQILCADSATLSGNLPQVGNGFWTIISGSGQLDNQQVANTMVRNLSLGENLLIWTISNDCGESSDTVSITVQPAPSTPEAGPNQSVCDSTVLLAANLPASGTGSWTLVSGSGTFNNANLPEAAVSGLSPGENVFAWTITSGSCPSLSDSVSIFRFDTLVKPDAGLDQEICDNQISISATPSTFVGTGQWTLVSGSGNIQSSSNPSTSVQNLGTGVNVFAWTYSNGVCPAKSDTVQITVNEAPSAALAGPNQNICSDQGILAGNLPNSGSGTWTLLTGSGIIVDSTLANSAVTGLGLGTNQFVWTISNNNCPSSSDTMSIFRSEPFAQVNAGVDTAICGSTFNLQALAPTTGSWSVVSGPAQVVPTNQPNAVATNLQQGQNAFVWSAQSGGCPVQTDTVVITSNQSFAANAGPSLQICTDTIRLQAPPLALPSTGKWTVDQGTGVFEDDTNPTTNVSGISTGVNVYRWTVSVPTCPDLSDTMAVVRIETSLDIHEDTSVCFIEGDSLVLIVPLEFTSFTWSNGATTRRIVLYAPDTLIATGTTAEGCTATDTIRVREGVCDPVARQIQGGFAVVLQPNPATNEVWMDIRCSEPGRVKLIVLNALGQEFGDEKTWYQDIETRMRLETDSWPSGMYTLRLSDGKRQWAGKVLIKR